MEMILIGSYQYSIELKGIISSTSVKLNNEDFTYSIKSIQFFVVNIG